MLEQAVIFIKCKNDKASAFEYLGKGLHALQDRVFNQSGIDNNNDNNFSSLNIKAIDKSEDYLDKFFERLIQQLGYNPFANSN